MTAGERDAEQLALPQALVALRRTQVRDFDARELRGHGISHLLEHVDLVGISEPGLSRRQGCDTVHDLQKPSPVAEIVQRAGLYEALQCLAVQAAHIGRATHMLDGLEGTFFFPGLDQ